MKDFLSQAGKLLKEHKQYKRQLTVFLCLAVIVAFSTVTALKLYGQAMTHKMEVLDCQYQVHQHIEDCYAKDEQGNPVIRYEKDDLVTTLVTDTEGKAVVNNLPLGSYYMKETIAGDHFVLNPEQKEFTLTAEDDTQAVVYEGVAYKK